MSSRVGYVQRRVQAVLRINRPNDEITNRIYSRNNSHLRGRNERANSVYDFDLTETDLSQLTGPEAHSDLVTKKRISARNFVGLYVILAVFCIAVWCVGYFVRGSMPWWISMLVGIAPLLAGFLHTWLVQISTEYRIFEDSLEIESGIVSRRIENIQLFRVRDLGFQQSIMGRLLNVGNIAVSSTDQSTPHLVLRGIDQPRELYETLRSLVAKSSAARRTMIVEDEAALENTDGIQSQ